MTTTARAGGAIDSAPASLLQTASAAPPKPTTSSKRSPIHPDDVHFSRVWLAVSALSAVAGLGVVRKTGWRGAGIAAAIGAIGAAYITVIAPRRPVLERHTLRLPRLPAALDGLRIGHLSDSHLGMPLAAGNLRWAVEQLQRERPDLIVFTGDFVHFTKAMHELSALICGLTAPLGIYGVPGNHDSWEAQGQLKQFLHTAGIELLLNEHRRLEWHGGELWLLGTDDAWDGTPDLAAALDGVPRDAFTLLLAHTPHDVVTAAQLGIDLQLSGHTHGGHMRLPLIGPLARPRYTGKYMLGMYTVGPTTLYVSRGIGGAPIRLNCPPEVALLTLRQ